MLINFADWTEEQKENFWEEWCGIGAYDKDLEASTPWGMPWTYQLSIEVDDTCETMRDIAEDYWQQVQDQIELLEDEEEQYAWD